MRAFSASQAVSPAIERTKRYLFSEFEFIPYLKMAAIACISEGFTANVSFATGSHLASDASAASPFHFSDEMIAVFALGILACLACAIIVFYLVARLRFVFFHCALYQTTEIRPVWSRYRRQGIRYFNAALILWIIFAVISALMVLPFALKIYHLFRAGENGLQLDSGGFFLLCLPLLVILPILGLIAFVVNVVLRDFMLPHMALEDASFREAWRAARTRIAAGKGSFLAYCFLRAVIPLVALLALLIVVGLPFFIIFGILTLSANGFIEMLEENTPLGTVFHIFFQILFGGILLAFGLVVEFGLGGPVATWVRTYALLYYGGRYQALGDILSPTPASAAESAAKTA